MSLENGVTGTLGAAILGIFGWAFTLNSRMSVQETETANLKETNGAKLDSLKELFETKFDDMDTRLERIERHVLNGSYKGHHG